MVSHSDPSTPWKMAGQMGCQSSSTSGGPHQVSPTFVVSMKVRSAPSSARRVSSSAPSRTTASRTSVVNFGFTTGLDAMFFSKSPTNFHRLVLVYHDETYEPCHYFEPTSFLQALYHHLDWAVTISLLVCQELVRIDQVDASSLIKLSQTGKQRQAPNRQARLGLHGNLSTVQP